MTVADKKPDDDMTMEEALSAIRELIADDDPKSEPADSPTAEPADERDLADELEALSEELDAVAQGQDDDSDAEEEPLDLAGQEEPLDLVAEDLEPLELEATDLEPLDLEAADLEPLDLDEGASLGEKEDELAASVEAAAADSVIEDIPKFLTELREALGEVEATDDEEVLPLSAEMELHREAPDERGRHEPAEREQNAPPAIPDISEEAGAPMSTGEDRILSADAAVKASSAFGNLSSLLTAGYEGEDNTLEGLVTAMLRPMLREWLDENLPRIVEQKVEAEIKRLSGN